MAYNWGLYIPLKSNIDSLFPKIAMYDRKYIFQTIIFGSYIRFRASTNHFLNGMILQVITSRLNSCRLCSLPPWAKKQPVMTSYPSLHERKRFGMF